MRVVKVVLVFIFLPLGLVYGQGNGKSPSDIIFLRNGEKITGRILSEDSTRINYAVKKNGLNVIASVERSSVDHITYAVYTDDNDIKNEQFSLGIGIGGDFGGVGTSSAYYFNRNVGAFVGLGYAFAGVGVTGGVRFRLRSKESTRRLVPVLLGMYGYNTAIYVIGATQFNKLFYGPTFGGGVDLLSRRRPNGYWSFELLVPVRGKEVAEYMDMLRATQGVQFDGGLSNVLLSIGYKFILH